MYKRQPDSREELGAIRGVSDKLRKSSYDGVLGAVEAGRRIPDSELPRVDKRKRRPTEVDGLVDLMAAVVKIRAHENNVAVPLLASRKDLEALAGGEREDCPLLEGWRRSIVGEELLDVVSGRVSIRVADGRLLVEAVDEGNLDA